MTDQQFFGLSDTAVAQIAKILQIGILSGTDITDNLRQMRLVADEASGLLVPTAEYTEAFENNIAEMLKEASSDD